MSKSMALDLARNHIRVNCINPGMVDTPLQDGFKPHPSIIGKAILKINFMRKLFKLRQQAWEDIIPAGKAGTPKDIANLTLFLATDDSKWMTGTVLTIDGGFTAGIY